MSGEDSDAGEPDVAADDGPDDADESESPGDDQPTDPGPTDEESPEAEPVDERESEASDEVSDQDGEPVPAEATDEDHDQDGELGSAERTAEDHDQDGDASNPWAPVGGPDAVDGASFETAASDGETDSGDGDESGVDGTQKTEDASASVSSDNGVDDGDNGDDDDDDDATNDGMDASWENWFHGDDGPPDDAAVDTDETADADGRPEATEEREDAEPELSADAGFEGEGTDLEATIAADDADRLDDGGGFFGHRNAPDEDQEMPLAAHIEEMLKRLAVVVAIAGVVSLLTFPFADRLINVIWYGILPGTDVARPRVYGILSLLFTRVKVASLAGIIAALPVFVYQTYQFMRPGLYPHERRYYLAAIPTSLILALVGVSFAYFIVLPAIFTYFLYYSESVATIGFALMKTFDLILLLMGYLAVVFQIPLFIMLAMMMGLVTRRWLADRRLIFWGAFLGISFLFSPDPTGMAPIIVALTMVGLFEGTLLVTKWAGR